jgi:cytoskeletal protein RodZ
MHARAINVKTGLVAAVAALLLLVGAGVAYATGDDSSAQPTGSNIEKAKSIALDHTNGGRVAGTEVGDEEGYYEIEVTSDDGARPTSTSTGTSTSSPRRPITKAPTTRTSPTTTSIQAEFEGTGRS